MLVVGYLRRCLQLYVCNLLAWPTKSESNYTNTLELLLWRTICLVSRTWWCSWASRNLSQKLLRGLIDTFSKWVEAVSRTVSDRRQDCVRGGGDAACLRRITPIYAFWERALRPRLLILIGANKTIEDFAVQLDRQRRRRQVQHDDGHCAVGVRSAPFF